MVAQQAKRLHQYEKADNMCIDFHGAAIVYADGREVPITEEMVLSACQNLEKCCWSMTPYLKKRK